MKLLLTIMLVFVSQASLGFYSEEARELCRKYEDRDLETALNCLNAVHADDKSRELVRDSAALGGVAVGLVAGSVAGALLNKVEGPWTWSTVFDIFKKPALGGLAGAALLGGLMYALVEALRPAETAMADIESRYDSPEGFRDFLDSTPEEQRKFINDWQPSKLVEAIFEVAKIFRDLANDAAAEGVQVAE